MDNYKYLIIGGGMTADAAVKGIREIDPEGSIGLISLEPDLPYNRPPLTKGLWKGKPFDSIWRKTHSRDVSLQRRIFNPALGKRLRLKHEDTANSMGRQAGRNMAGVSEPYLHLPYFFSDLFELGYEAVGELDSRLETRADWAEPFQKGIIYYFMDNRGCGVLLWNVWGKVSGARELIAQPGPFQVEELAAKMAPAWKITY